MESFIFSQSNNSAAETGKCLLEAFFMKYAYTQQGVTQVEKSILIHPSLADQPSLAKCYTLWATQPVRKREDIQ